MRSKIDCNEVEKILFQSSLDELNKEQKSQIVNHIKSCEQCRVSQKILNNISQSMLNELNESQIRPNTAMLESLKNKMANPKESRNSTFYYIKSFLEFRIPVYQVVTVLLIIGVFSFFLNNNSQNVGTFNNNISFIASIDSNKISMSLQNSMELIDGYKKGKSIVEDSVLSNFIQSAM